MFAFNWLTGFAFWLLYTIFGGLFCVIYTKYVAKDTYAFITGTLEKAKPYGRYRSLDGVHFANRIDIGIIILVTFVLWPIPFIIVAIGGTVFLLGKCSSKLVLTFLKGLAYRLPDVSFKKQDK